MLDWTLDGDGIYRLEVGSLVLRVAPKGVADQDRHVWMLSERVEGALLPLGEGRSRMLNGARERVLRTALSVLSVRAGETSEVSAV